MTMLFYDLNIEHGIFITLRNIKLLANIRKKLIQVSKRTRGIIIMRLHSSGLNRFFSSRALVLMLLRMENAQQSSMSVLTEEPRVKTHERIKDCSERTGKTSALVSLV